MCVCVCVCARARVCVRDPSFTTQVNDVLCPLLGLLRADLPHPVCCQALCRGYQIRNRPVRCCANRAQCVPPSLPSSPLSTLSLLLSFALSLSLWFLATCLLTRTWPLIPCRFLEKNRDPFPEDVREMLCESESTFISSLFNVRLPSSLCCRILFSPCLFSRPLLLFAPLSVKQHLLAHFLHSLPFLVPHLCAPLPSERIPSQCNCWCRSVVYDAAAPQLTASTNGAKWQCAQVWNNAPVMCFKTFRFCVSVSLCLCVSVSLCLCVSVSLFAALCFEAVL